MRVTSPLQNRTAEDPSLILSNIFNYLNMGHKYITTFYTQSLSLIKMTRIAKTNSFDILNERKVLLSFLFSSNTVQTK